MNVSSSSDLRFFEPFTVTYPSHGYALRGYLLLPEGLGLFPTIIFQHGSSGLLSSNIPVFLIQAQNDHSLMPTYTLGMELARLNKPHEMRIYPSFGTTAMEGHGLFGRGVDWWNRDVERFLAHWLNEN